ncbi:hypothetical protein GKR71_16360 [Providencia sp. wls1922]|uniref:hypothetical protein n=1 Tax=Providencia sp. wls1922 TaxID=2675152 RepID=UPI0012B53599|nr:hypothetical protein [Providencia sp. wls1922]MTC47403.1 hypothetical protein [Providencia sp. wls1922]
MVPSSKQTKKKNNNNMIIVPFIFQFIMLIIALFLIYLMYIGKITLDTQINPTISFLVDKYYGLEIFYVGLFLLFIAIIYCVHLSSKKLKDQHVDKLIKYSGIFFSVLISGKLWAYSTLLFFLSLAPHYVPSFPKSKTPWIFIIIFPVLAVALTLSYPYICKKIIYKKDIHNKKKP